jgi:hypothetical protein
LQRASSFSASCSVKSTVTLLVYVFSFPIYFTIYYKKVRLIKGFLYSVFRVVQLRLSELENELLLLLECGGMTLNELRRLNPRFIGAVGRLKSLGLVEFLRLPNREVHVFAKNNLLEGWENEP